jgi:hypothetical protein
VLPDRVHSSRWAEAETEVEVEQSCYLLSSTVIGTSSSSSPSSLGNGEGCLISCTVLLAHGSSWVKTKDD